MKMSGLLKQTNPLSGKESDISIGGFVAGVVGIVMFLAQLSLAQKVAGFVENKTKIDTSPGPIIQQPSPSSNQLRKF